jgi:hypothetical protein
MGVEVGVEVEQMSAEVGGGSERGKSEESGAEEVVVEIALGKRTIGRLSDVQVWSQLL